MKAPTSSGIGRNPGKRGMAMTALEHVTIGQVRAAGRAMGDDQLLIRVLEGSKLACYQACAFFASELKDCADCVVRADCHRALAR